MIQIAICDDIEDQIAAIYKYVDEYMISNSLDAQIHKFTNPEQLIRVCETESFHILLDCRFVQPDNQGDGVCQEGIML